VTEVYSQNSGLLVEEVEELFIWNADIFWLAVGS